jgi:hypothetical protein
MDDSHVSFGPLRENREVADETINERESTTSRHETEIVRDTHLLELLLSLHNYEAHNHSFHSKVHVHPHSNY